jgi:hypothetical protein
MGEEGHGTDIKMVAVVKCNQVQLGKWMGREGKCFLGGVVWWRGVTRVVRGGEGWRAMWWDGREGVWQTSGVLRN